MTIEGEVVHQDPFGFGFGFGLEGNLEHYNSENWLDILETQTGYDWNFPLSSPPRPAYATGRAIDPIPDTAVDVPPVKPRRRRQRIMKNKEEEREKQRMTHIMLERNRRKQINTYLSALRQLMPDSYLQRSDQASIIGGAINYVKELEQRLQFLDRKNKVNRVDNYTGSSSLDNSPGSTADSGMDGKLLKDDVVEVSVVENHANLKIRSRRRPKQLLKMVSGLQKLRFSILHLNVTTVNKTVVLYTLMVKIGDDFPMSKGSADELARVVSQILDSRIDQEIVIA